MKYEAQFYTVSEVSDILGLGRTKGYEYIKDVEKKGEPFRVVKIGGLYKIPKRSFQSWIDNL